MAICPIILAGGSGSRLWPFSRQHYPKQFLKLFGEQTMLQQTLSRLEGDGFGIELIPTQVICNEVHRFLVADQARNIEHVLQEIILEPEGRNTAPALTVAALWQLRSAIDPVLLMMPADHLIKNIDAFQVAIALGYEQAEKGEIVTFGINPDSPETGYGYIECSALDKSAATTGVQMVKSFTEKPTQSIAEKYLTAGNHLWNSGLFMMRSSVWVDVIKQANPAIYESCERAIKNGDKDGDFYWLDEEAFATSPSDSIDYAVMENIGKESPINASVITLDVGWSDIGSWSSVWQEREQDDAGNVIDGDVIQTNTRNCLIKAQDRLVAVIGCEDLVVVDTADALMIADKGNSQDVKIFVDGLKENSRKEYENHLQVFRPWGSYETLQMRDGFQVKRIIVDPGKRLSLQLHHQRSEHWVVVEGVGTVTLGAEVFDLKVNESTCIPVETKHRLENKTPLPLTMIEIQVGSYLGEDDIVRFDDDFGRA
jgi:mannose-1-phosphate guanylyltransferase/mannose-6-phosphate isomerase